MIEKYLVKKDNRAGGLEGNRAGIEEHDEPALLMAVLSAGTVRVEGVLFSDDSRHFLACLVALGFTVEIEGRKKCVTVTGCGGRIPAGGGNRRRKRRDSGAFSCGDARIFGRVL